MVCDQVGYDDDDDDGYRIDRDGGGGDWKRWRLLWRWALYGGVLSYLS